MLERLDKGRLVGYAAALLLIVAVAMRLHAHSGGGAPPPSVSLAPLSPRAPGGGAAVTEGSVAAPSHELWVDVAGAVRRPGLYKLPAGSRVAAALDKAGGVSRRGDSTGINLAAPLHDGQQVIVPRRGAVSGAASAGAASAADGAGGGTISLSQATQAQLETLDGIGPALASRILQYREQHGGFRSIDELKEVSGIGDKRFEAIRGSLAP